MTGSGILDKVAGPIGEALILTASDAWIMAETNPAATAFNGCPVFARRREGEQARTGTQGKR